MNILCIICSEFMTNDEDIIVTPCGHCFHNACIGNWIRNSSSCPTCRKALSRSSLIKVFFETDPNRFHVLHNDLLKANESLTNELENIKEKSRKQESELLEINAKYRESSEKNKKLERDRQLDEMALAGLRMIKDESAKELLKLNTQMNTLKLDLLAERQLRRVHQTTLHKLEPSNENYDIRSITVDEDPVESTATNYNITPFWQLNPEAAKNETIKNDHPFIIPSKIQKANENKLSTKKLDNQGTKKRSSISDESDGPSTSRNTLMFSFSDNSNAQCVPSTSKAGKSSVDDPKKTIQLNFGNMMLQSVPYRFGSNTTSTDDSSSQPSSSSSSLLNRLNSYRKNPKDSSNPRSSER
ncbi:E3 ubiquitin-protein ligase trul-1-like [Chironomus tepperi]|uniref:E3 ubiquitin-protein ligase trul-1-like n=1 Tax=Chironomus tepperi TaxID=113505 RepID=UPI00391F9C96